jgi:hypothetical protein
MDPIEETFIDKAHWGDGPWQAEPDRIEWRAKDSGFPCLMLRNRIGAWCGYVGLPEGHRWFGASYDDVDVDVHGGLTFADRCMEDARPLRERVCHLPRPGESDVVWWLGFDCAHHQDLAPGMETLFETTASPWPSVYRDVAYVRSEVEHLSEQVA